MRRARLRRGVGRSVRLARGRVFCVLFVLVAARVHFGFGRAEKTAVLELFGAFDQLTDPTGSGGFYRSLAAFARVGFASQTLGAAPHVLNRIDASTDVGLGRAEVVGHAVQALILDIALARRHVLDEAARHGALAARALDLTTFLDARRVGAATSAGQDHRQPGADAGGEAENAKRAELDHPAPVARSEFASELLWARVRACRFLQACCRFRATSGFVNWAAVLLCAGLGTRLRPLTELVPKPLVWLGDRPLVDHAVACLHAGGAREFEFNAFHLASQVAAHVARRADDPALPGSQLRCVVETELLGTAGGIRGLARDLAHVVIWNGDIYAPDVDVSRLITLGRQEWPVLLVAPPASGPGTLGLDAQGRVVRLRGYVAAGETRAADYIGIAVLPDAFVRSLPRHGCLVGDGLVPWLASGKPVTTLSHRGHWSDGGTIAQYLAQNRHWLGRRGVTNHLGQGAALAPEVALVESVVGEGARIIGSGAVERSVIWPGARAESPLSDAVVLSDGRVVHGVTAGGQA